MAAKVAYVVYDADGKIVRHGRTHGSAAALANARPGRGWSVLIVAEPKHDYAGWEVDTSGEEPELVQT